MKLSKVHLFQPIDSPKGGVTRSFAVPDGVEAIETVPAELLVKFTCKGGEIFYCGLSNLMTARPLKA